MYPLSVCDDFALFSEPQSSWIVEVKSGREKEFVKHLGDDAICLGQTQESEIAITRGEEKVLALDIDQVLKKWKGGYV